MPSNTVRFSTFSLILSTVSSSLSRSKVGLFSIIFAVLSSDLVMEQARRMAVRVAAAGSSDEERITRVWLAAYGRAPSSGERESAGRYLAGVQDRSEAWSRLCHALMQSGEFQIVY